MAKQNKKKKGAPKKKQLQSNFPTKKETVEVKAGIRSVPNRNDFGRNGQVSRPARCQTAVSRCP